MSRDDTAHCTSTAPWNAANECERGTATRTGTSAVDVSSITACPEVVKSKLHSGIYILLSRMEIAKSREMTKMLQCIAPKRGGCNGLMERQKRESWMARNLTSHNMLLRRLLQILRRSGPMCDAEAWNSHVSRHTLCVIWTSSRSSGRTRRTRHSGLGSQGRKRCRRKLSGSLRISRKGRFTR